MTTFCTSKPQPSFHFNSSFLSHFSFNLRSLRCPCHTIFSLFLSRLSLHFFIQFLHANSSPPSIFFSILFSAVNKRFHAPTHFFTSSLLNPDLSLQNIFRLHYPHRFLGNPCYPMIIVHTVLSPKPRLSL